MPWGYRRSVTNALPNGEVHNNTKQTLRLREGTTKTGDSIYATLLIQQIPDLIRYKTGDLADAYELLIALINDVSEPVSQLFQGQMTSTIRCSGCDSTTSRTDTHRISPYTSRKMRVRHSKKDYMTSFNQKHLKGLMHTGATHVKNTAWRQKHSSTHAPLQS